MSILKALESLAENTHHCAVTEIASADRDTIHKAIETNNATIIKSCFTDSAKITAHRSSIVHVSTQN